MQRVGIEYQPLPQSTPEIRSSRTITSEPYTPPTREQLERDVIKQLVAADIYLQETFKDVFKKIAFTNSDGSSVTLYRNDPEKQIQPIDLLHAFPAVINPGKRSDIRKRYKLNEGEGLDVWVSARHMGVFIGLQTTYGPSTGSVPTIRTPDLESFVLETIAYGQTHIVKTS